MRFIAQLNEYQLDFNDGVESANEGVDHSDLLIDSQASIHETDDLHSGIPIELGSTASGEKWHSNITTQLILAIAKAIISFWRF